MVIDTSAIVAIFFNEPDSATYRNHIANSPVRLISAATFLKASMVIEGRYGEAGGAELDLWLHKAEIEIISVTAENAESARRAWRRFGKGRHPAGLNFGDCFSYALAKTTGEPLLYKGNDFAQTDIDAA